MLSFALPLPLPLPSAPSPLPLPSPSPALSPRRTRRQRPSPRARARAASPPRAPPNKLRVFAPPPSPSPPLDNALLDRISDLALAKGALGRGVRATLRAFHRRASSLPPPLRVSLLPIYIEIGPAYVLASAAPRPEPVTRYAVEQRAWPTLRSLCDWKEETAAAARARGAVLRPLPPGQRFGRHLFIQPATLSALLQAASAFVVRDHPLPADAPPLANLEAVLPVPRMPLPGVRTVAARCPRRASHAHRDANPSLILWMNEDARSGGALCPVCRERDNFLTWRVLYLSTRAAALYTPLSRATLPHRARAAAAAAAVKPPRPRTQRKRRRSHRPIGACVMPSRKIPHVGHVISMAYVTASLRTSDTSCAIPHGQHLRLRTAGTRARQTCPIQLLLWSDRRSKGPLVAQRVEQVAWYARQLSDTSLQSEQWLPTPLVSVSAMKPSSWRDVIASNGRSVSVPAGWEPTAQSWVLFDVDDLHGLDHCVSELAAKLVLVARRNVELSGRCLVVHTGPRGVHLWAELREVREHPREWFRKEEVRVWYAELGCKLLRACHRAGTSGGLVDMSSCAAGRFARRPGWRLLKDGTLFRSRVVMHVPGTVKSRKPRIP